MLLFLDLQPVSLRKIALKCSLIRSKLHIPDFRNTLYIWVIVIIHNIFAALVQPLTMPMSSGLRAAGDVQYSLWSSILCTMVFRTALSFALGLWLNMGIVGITWAMVLSWCLKAALDMARFYSGKWREKRVI